MVLDKEGYNFPFHLMYTLMNSYSDKNSIISGATLQTDLWEDHQTTTVHVRVSCPSYTYSMLVFMTTI